MARRDERLRALDPDPLWYKDAIIYQLHVRSFFDSAKDGVGDFRGLTQKLDYLQDLGVTGIWLLPFYPSPLRDDGYDIADYTAVHKIYGTTRDVEVFIQEAHRRGMRVITELVVNHTSDQHPWFQRARHAKPGSTWRNFYVWSDDPKKYSDARIIFKDFESSNWTWDPVAKAYYWHRFYSHQPDLNYENPAVRKAILGVLDSWFELGVDGLRLDAVPYLYEQDGTTCENLPETHGFLKVLRRHVDARFEGRMLLAEANQWPEDAAAYFGKEDECHMAFNFPLMPRLFMAVYMEDRFPIIDIVEQTPVIPDGCQWAIFLRNHDELTLEMVTEEERDYMYRVYADDRQARINLGIRRRLAPLLGNHRRRIELMNGLLFSLPGTPILYYGDEIGMGDNIYLGDRNGVRTPMQWSADRNAGFSRADPQRLYLPVITSAEYNAEAVNVEQQQENPHSLLWWMKRLIRLRKRSTAFSRGGIEFLHPENRKILCFLRRDQSDVILVVANLSRFVQYVELDLSQFRGFVPVEFFGGTEFPPIGELPYLLTLGPHAFYWFALQAPRPEEAVSPTGADHVELPLLRVAGEWGNVLSGQARTQLENVLPWYLASCRWFGAKARRLKSATIVEAVRVAGGETVAYLTFVRAGFVEGEAQTYVLPLAYAAGPAAGQVRERAPHAILARLSRGGAGEEGLLYDAVWDPGFSGVLLDAISRRRRFQGSAGDLRGSPTRALRQLGEFSEGAPDPSVMKAEQSNTSVLYGDRLILKILRRLEEGLNPDLEIGRFLTEKASFPHTPSVAGALTYTRDEGVGATVGILQAFVPNQGDAWEYTLDALDGYMERALVHRAQLAATPAVSVGLVELLDEKLPGVAGDTIGPYLQPARLLGQRTAELHMALASATDEPDLRPEPFTPFDQRSLYQSVRVQAAQAFDLLGKHWKKLPEAAWEDAQAILKVEPEVDRRLRSILDRRLTGLRTRCHGDYHLGQVLYTGKDFVIIDFEGEPARSLSERRLKRSPLRDVAGMLRSYHYAAYTALNRQLARGVIRPEEEYVAEHWVRFWYLWVAVTFLGSYVHTAHDAPFLPRNRDELKLLLDFFMLEKAFYELRYELNSRPAWARVPLKGITELLALSPRSE